LTWFYHKVFGLVQLEGLNTTNALRCSYFLGAQKPMLDWGKLFGKWLKMRVMETFVDGVERSRDDFSVYISGQRSREVGYEE
jgi:hypothetical protein